MMLALGVHDHKVNIPVAAKSSYHPHTYYKWQQKLYHKYASAEAGGFYEVPFSNAGSAAVTIEIGQYSMDIYNGADERTISSVLRALKTC